MNSIKLMARITTTVAALAAGGLLPTLTLSAAEPDAAEAAWKDKLITPVTNPIYFEDPRITSEVRPIFMQHWFPNTFDYSGGSVPLGGDAQVYALQLRLALTEKLALIATKDGYIQLKPGGALQANHGYGWADVAAGLKYALVDNAEKELLVTPGFTITVPVGSHSVLQGDGSGEWNLFVSGSKGWKDFHVTGNLGFRIPNNFGEQTAQAHYSLQLDYHVHDYFIPFFAVNGYTILSDGNNLLLGAVPLNTEMYDLINFGSTDAAGTTQLTVGGGFRSRLRKNLDLGCAYEVGVVDPVGIFDSRVTVDMIWRF
jgi:hypothetical protein